MKTTSILLGLVIAGYSLTANADNQIHGHLTTDQHNLVELSKITLKCDETGIERLTEPRVIYSGRKIPIGDEGVIHFEYSDSSSNPNGIVDLTEDRFRVVFMKNGKEIGDYQKSPSSFYVGGKGFQDIAKHDGTPSPSYDGTDQTSDYKKWKKAGERRFDHYIREILKKTRDCRNSS